jgi:hypothetical protein
MDHSDMYVVGAAVVAGFCSWLGSYFSFKAKLKELKHSFEYNLKQSASERVRAHTFQQLNDLFGPLMATRHASKMLWEKLSDTYASQNGLSPDDTFRLVDLLPSIKDDPSLGPYVDEIMKLGERAADLLTTKGGLVEGEWPESFRKYVGHVSIMRAAYNGGNSKPGVAGSMADSSFPEDLDADIERKYNVVKQKLAKIHDSAEAP